MESTPTPSILVAAMQRARYLRQCEEAKTDSERRKAARKRGYQGPITRADLAAQCLRQQRNTQ